VAPAAAAIRFALPGVEADVVVYPPAAENARGAPSLGDREAKQSE